MGSSSFKSFKAIATTIVVSFIAIQYAFNPLVPEPRNLQRGMRSPQSVERLITTEAPQLALHTDELGLIVQSDGDGGDTAQRTGMFYYVHHDPEGFKKALDHLEVYPGIYVRHPLQGDFRSDPRRFSRDQQRPLIIALGKYKMKDHLWRMMKAHALRFGKYQNMDFLGPIGLGEYIRAFGAKPLYPVLMITDTSLLVGSLHLILRASMNPDESDDNNHVMTLLQSRDVMPTPFSWLAIKTYQVWRPKNYGNSVLGLEDPVHGALAWYHRAENGGNPLIGDAVFQALNKN